MSVTFETKLQLFSLASGPQLLCSYLALTTVRLSIQLSVIFNQDHYFISTRNIQALSVHLWIKLTLSHVNKLCRLRQMSSAWIIYRRSITPFHSPGRSTLCAQMFWHKNVKMRNLQTRKNEILTGTSPTLKKSGCLKNQIWYYGVS